MTGVRADHGRPLAAPTSPGAGLAGALAAAALAVALAACGGPDATGGGASSAQPAATSTLSTDAPAPGERDYPDVETAELTPAGDSYDLAVTIRARTTPRSATPTAGACSPTTARCSESTS